jgi:antitoxin (DNA-binding transcriptional repressor) of toxin-antitoxin stability system
MGILIDVAEAAERLEELVELPARGDDILICRDERPVATLTHLANKTDPGTSS